MATAHLVCGFLGVGKTTFSEKLTEECPAIRFSVDELYMRLFADGPTYHLDANALARLFAVLNDLWPRVLKAGVDVVLDFGFWNRIVRDEARRLARSVGAETRLYWLQCPDELAIHRCLERNGKPGAFLISEEGYRDLKARFQGPSGDEVFELVNTA